jgi:hypothetical protein
LETSEAIAWCAGFFDGEGCISATRDGNSKTAFVVSMVVCQQVREPLEFFQQQFGGRIVRSERARVWRLYLRKQELWAALRILQPYLLVKRTQALMMLELLELLDTKTTNWPQENYIKADALVASIKAAKRVWD